MTSAELFKEKLEKLLAESEGEIEESEEIESGRTIGGKKKKVGAYQKKLGTLLESGMTMKQAHKKLKASGGSDALEYADPIDAELARLESDYKLRKMELKNKRDYKVAKQQILEQDKKYGPMAKLQREFEERGRVLEALKSKSIPLKKKEEIAQAYYKDAMKFEAIPDTKYAPKLLISPDYATAKKLLEGSEKILEGSGKRKKSKK
jgi:hypothetical protein